MSVLVHGHAYTHAFTLSNITGVICFNNDLVDGDESDGMEWVVEVGMLVGTWGGGGWVNRWNSIEYDIRDCGHQVVIIILIRIIIYIINSVRTLSLFLCVCVCVCVCV